MIIVPDAAMRKNVKRYGEKIAADCPAGTGVLVLLVRDGKIFIASNLSAGASRSNLRKASEQYAPANAFEMPLGGILHG